MTSIGDLLAVGRREIGEDVGRAWPRVTMATRLSPVARWCSIAEEPALLSWRNVMGHGARSNEEPDGG